MNCSRCSADVPPEDLFCEDCGAPQAGPAAQPPGDCAKCGAASELIDADGFCSVCGFQRQARGRDHCELAISPGFAGVTDRGLRHHRNEDFLAMQTLGAAGAHLIVVCDGVSSTRDSDRASEAAAESALRSLVGAVARNHLAPKAAMETAIAAAQTAVAAIPAQTNSGQDSAASTIVAALAQGNCVTIGWLGDSRAYWLGGSEVKQLTRDDSWLTEVVASGEMSEADAAQSGNAHAITRWLGADAANGAASVVQFVAAEPGHVLICTDGLWNYAPDPSVLGDMVRANGEDTLAAARALVDFANEQGGHDNITAALLWLGV